MASIKGPSTSAHDGASFRIAIVHARWNTPVIDALVAGAISKLKQSGVKDANIVVQSVPGSYELPLACAKVIASGRTQTGSAPDLLGLGATPNSSAAELPRPFDAVIAVGVLIKGSTMHFEYICDSVSHGLMRVQLDTGTPVIFGVLTALTDDQALERAGIGRGENKGHNHGEDWGLAAVEMATHSFCVTPMKKKVLLMGASGSGKTSMRSMIFSNNPASLTSRLGATIDVEQNHVRFLGDLILNLWDCGGQDAFMDSYLSTQRSTIFSHAGVMIYVFDVESREMAKDLEYYRDCLEGLSQFSKDASVFLLVHKMDLVRQGERSVVFQRKVAELAKASGDVSVKVLGTSIYDETLYKAWSSIVNTLIPNARNLNRHLRIFAEACSATEVILFERATFLVIATSSFSDTSDSTSSSLEPKRYERTSELIKAFKQSCARLREEFHSLEMEFAEFTAVLDEMTKNTYVLVVVHDPVVETAAIKMNIRMARKKFEELQEGDTLI